MISFMNNSNETLFPSPPLLISRMSFFFAHWKVSTCIVLKSTIGFAFNVLFPLDRLPLPGFDLGGPGGLAAGAAGAAGAG